MLSDHKSRMKYFILFLILSLEYHSIKSKPLANNWAVNAAKYGVRMTPQGKLYRYDNYFDQVIMIKLPRIEEYQNILNSLKLYCQVTNPVNFESLVANTSDEVLVRTEALNFHSLVKKRCVDFHLRIEEHTNDLLIATFQDLLPNPVYERAEHIPFNSNARKILTEDEIYMRIMGGEAPKLDLDNSITAQSERFLADNEKLKIASHKLNTDFLKFNRNFIYSAEDNSFVDISQGPVDADNLTNPSKKPRTIVGAEKQGDLEDDGKEFIPIKQVSVPPTVNSSPSPVASKPVSPETPLSNVLVDSRVETTSPRGPPSSSQGPLSSSSETPISSSSESSINTRRVYDKEVGRKKRELVTLAVIGIVAGIALLIGAGVAGLGLAIANRVEINELKRNVEFLMERQRLSDKESVALRESFLGLTNFASNLTSTSSNSIDSINLMQQMFGQKMLETSREINMMTGKDQVANSMILMLIEQVNLIDRMEGVVQSLKQTCRDFENGIAQLNNNMLSTHFVPFHKLREILLEIRANLPSEYNLGIGLDEINRYYMSRLVTYDKTKDYLLIRLVVPLALKDDAPTKPFDLFLPSFNPIPCAPNDNRTCRVGEKSDLVTAKEGTLIDISPKSTMACAHAGNLMNCMQFAPSPHTIRGHCMAQFLVSNWTGIDHFCRFFETTAKYQPILIDNGVYGCHGNKDLIYSKQCANASPTRLNIAEDTVFDIAKIPYGCSLLVNNDSYPGGFRTGMKNYEYQMVTKQFYPTSFRQQTTLSISFNTTPFKLFNTSEISSIPFTIDTKILDEISEQTIGEIEVIKKRIEYDSKNFSSKNLSPYNIIDLFNQSFLMILSFILTFIAVRRLPFLRFAAPIFVIEPANGFEFLNLISPSNSFIPSIDQRLTSTSLLIVFLCVCAFIVMRNNYRRKVMTMSYGTVKDRPASRFFIRITLFNKKGYILTTITEKVTFVRPVSGGLRPDVAKAELNDNSFLFYVQMNSFRLTEKMTITLSNSLGKIIQQFEETMDFAIEDVTWRGKDPILLANSYGIAHVDIISDPRPIIISPVHPSMYPLLPYAYAQNASAPFLSK